MKAFYSILYFQSNSFSEEKVAGGLLVVSPDKVWFSIHEGKLDIVAKLVNEHVKDQLRATLKNIKKFTDELNKHDSTAYQSALFKKPEAFFTEAYGSYLHKYSQGILQYSTPMPLNLNVDKKQFDFLFEKFIGPKKEGKAIDGKSDFHREVQQKLKEADLKEKVDINLKLSPQKLNGIYSDTNVRMIGKNGKITALQDIDFTISLELLGRQLNEWDVLVHALNQFGSIKSLKQGDYNLVFNKPIAHTPQEKLLNRILGSSKEFNVIALDETDAVLDKIDDEYKPFSLGL